MDGYTRVKKAITFSGPDRIPLWAPEEPAYSDIDAVFAGRMPLMGTTGGSEVTNEKGETLRLIGVDGIAVSNEEAARGVKDEWGCVWKDYVGTTGIVTDHPISDWKSFKHFQFPDPYKDNRLGDAVQKLKTLETDNYILAIQWSVLLERIAWLMGHSNLFINMINNRSLFDVIAEGVTEYAIGLINRFAEIGAHGIMMGDDWGTQTGSWISSDTFDDVFKPFYVKIIKQAHDKGLDFHLHTCGNCFELIPNLIECGVDVINTWQPKVIGIERLGEAFGGNLCFQASADIQSTLPSASPSEVRNETKLIIEKLGTHNGGLIGITYSGPTVNADNVQVMLETFKEYRPAFHK